jgi:hypothetical protein
VRLQGARELRPVIGDGIAENHANVSPFTFQLGRFDGASGPERLSEKWILIILDQCAKFCGKLWDHEIVSVRGDGGAAILTKIDPPKARIGWC